MNNNLYNIDSKFRNTTSYPNSANFVYNRMDQTVGASTVVEPFNEKNVIEMRILSLELPNTIYYITSARGNNKIKIAGVDKTLTDGSYTENELATALSALTANVTFTFNNSTGKMTITNTTGVLITITFTASGTDYQSLGSIIGFTSDPTIANTASSTGTNMISELAQTYLFLRINDFGNLINRNHRYVGKIIIERVKSVSNEKTGGININILSNQYKLITNVVKFDQPTNIQKLSISLEDEYGNLIGLNGGNWSFTLETTVITNTILKNYNEIKFYNDEVMDRILKAKMLSYYDKQADQTTNSTLTSTYSSNISNLNNVQEYTPFGSTNNYSPSYSYFKPNDNQ
jgi:hypothetical protein